MNEFEQKDYEQSRTYADAIKNNADNIMDIFNAIDNTMKELYGDSWQSSGAIASSERYDEIKQNYEVFYNNVIKMHDHIYSVTASNEATDTSVSNNIAGV